MKGSASKCGAPCSILQTQNKNAATRKAVPVGTMFMVLVIALPFKLIWFAITLPFRVLSWVF